MLTLSDFFIITGFYIDVEEASLLNYSAIIGGRAEISLNSYCVLIFANYWRDLVRGK
jgi:hypothetical protein